MTITAHGAEDELTKFTAHGAEDELIKTSVTARGVSDYALDSEGWIIMILPDRSI